MGNLKKTYIIGTGGFAREVASIFDDLKEYDKFAGFIDRQDVVDKLQGTKIMERSVMPQDSFSAEMGDVVVAIGDPKLREKVVSSLPEDTRFATIIHPNATVSRWASLEEGCIVCANCIITTQVNIGKHAQLNLATTIGHDCTIGNFFTTAPSVNVSGNCNIENRVYFGTGSGIRQGLNVVSDVTVGMGAMVVKHLAEPGIYVGIPAKKL